MEEVKIIKVSSVTSVPQLAGSICICISEGHDVELRAVGASAVSQMYKAITVARGSLAQKGKDLYIRPGFSETKEADKKSTVMTARIVFL